MQGVTRPDTYTGLGQEENAWPDTPRTGKMLEPVRYGWWVGSEQPEPLDASGARHRRLCLAVVADATLYAVPHQAGVRSSDHCGWSAGAAQHRCSTPAQRSEAPQG